jgi:hypothetical protein
MFGAAPDGVSMASLKPVWVIIADYRRCARIGGPAW